MTASDVLQTAKVAKAKALLQSASGASKQLESDVTELVTMRAWAVLGYTDFKEMWLAECGFAAPTYVTVLAVAAYVPQMNTNRRYPNGLTSGEVGRELGMAVHKSTNGGTASSAVSKVAKQVRSGAPLREISVGVPRSRGVTRRAGAAPNELVSTSFNVLRRDADAIEDIARKASVPNSEIYRQAVSEYLARYAASRPRKT